MRHVCLAALLCVAAGITAPLATPGAAQEWRPFAEPEPTRSPRRAERAVEPEVAKPPLLQPMGGVLPSRGAAPPQTFDDAQRRATSAAITTPPDERGRAVERAELAPVMATDGSGLPHEQWRGLEAGKLEQLIAQIELPPRSPALHALLRRLLVADLAAPSGGGNESHFLALRLEALHRSGLIAEETELLAKSGSAAGEPLIKAFKTRALIGAGNTEEGCATAKSLAGQKNGMPNGLRAEIILLAGYCAAAGDNRAAAGLAADLAREEGMEASFGLMALDALALGGKPKLPLPKQVSLTDYRLLGLIGGADLAQIIERGEPALVGVLAADASLDPRLRLAAGEVGARLNVLSPERLADVYRAQVFEPNAIADPLGARVDQALRRALLFKAAEAERTPFKRTRVIRAFVDDARRAGLYLPALQMVSRDIDQIAPVPEIGWFAETAIEAHLASRNYDRARQWIAFSSGLDRPGGGQPLPHWLALADIADPGLRTGRGQSLASLDELAQRGRIAPDMLHRLATVLDALDYNVPIPLWERASRTPQPTTGHLPATGVLSELQDAAKKKEFGRTVLLAMLALGPAGAEGAHMIALGDSIRALKRAGLEADARRLGFEALFAGWPRAALN